VKTDPGREILELDEAWIDAFNDANLDRMVALYAPDAIVMPPGEEELHGRARIRDWLARFFDRHTAEQHLVNDEVQVMGDWAFIRGHFQLTVRERCHGTEQVQRGKHLVLWRRDAGAGWLAARDIWNLSSAADTSR